MYVLEREPQLSGKRGEAGGAGRGGGSSIQVRGVSGWGQGRHSGRLEQQSWLEIQGLVLVSFRDQQRSRVAPLGAENLIRLQDVWTDFIRQGAAPLCLTPASLGPFGVTQRVNSRLRGGIRIPSCPPPQACGPRGEARVSRAEPQATSRAWGQCSRWGFCGGVGRRGGLLPREDWLLCGEQQTLSPSGPGDRAPESVLGMRITAVKTTAAILALD